MLVSPCPSSAARICRTCMNMLRSTGQCHRCRLGWKKRRNRYVSVFAGRTTADHFGCVIIASGAAMLPAQACAKWPPCLFFHAHDRSRRILNITTPFDHCCRCNVTTVWNVVSKTGCNRLFRFRSHPKAQRSHVTCIRSTILLTFSSVEASAERPWTVCTFRENVPGGDSELH